MRILSRRSCIGAMLVVAAAAVPGARASWVFNGQDGSNWFDGNNWWDTSNDGFTTAPTVGVIPDSTQTTNINTGVQGSIVDFDPANQIGNPNNITTLGRLYVDSADSGPGSSSDPNFTSGTPQPNTLEIDSGTLYIQNNYVIVGRSSALGTLIQNGGTFNIDNRIELGNVSGSGNEGDYIYHGGVLSSGQNATSNPGTSPGVRLGVGSGTTGKFVDYNNGPAGNITVSGFFISYNSSSTGIVEFHYDNGGIRPIQIVENPNAADSNGVNNSGELSFRNQSSGAQSSRLNLVLDSSPTMTLVGGVEVPQNLGLFTTLDPTKIVGNSGQFKGFYDSTGTNQLPEGAAISLRAPNGYTDTWDISYQGTINFSDPSISAISSITGPNNLLGSATTGGSDVVLMGVSAIAPVIGDANGDGVVNGADLAILVGNNGKSVTGGYAAADFNDDGVVNQDDWSIFDYGVALYNHSVPPVPEPAGAALVLLAPMCGLRRRRR